VIDSPKQIVRNTAGVAVEEGSTAAVVMLVNGASPAALMGLIFMFFFTLCIMAKIVAAANSKAGEWVVVSFPGASGRFDCGRTTIRWGIAADDALTL
jgi:hypothetical protein